MKLYSMSNFKKFNLYENIEYYLPIPYKLDERTNFSERYPIEYNEIITNEYFEKIKQIVSTPREIRRHIRPPTINKNVSHLQINPQQYNLIHRIKPINGTVHEENEVHLSIHKSSRHSEIMKSSNGLIQNSLKQCTVNTVSTDTLDMNIEDYLKMKNLEKENIILEQQKDIAQVQTLAFYLSEQLMLTKFNEKMIRSESSQEHSVHQNHQQRPHHHHHHQKQEHQWQKTPSNVEGNQSANHFKSNIKLFSDKYTEISEPLSLDTTGSVFDSYNIHSPRNLEAILVTLDNTWLISWDKPESIDSSETTCSTVVGYVLSVNGIEIKRISSVNVTRSIINLSQSTKYPVTLEIQSIDENNYLSKPKFITLNA
ncbi:hypothetical protein MN116_005410 [Schistosoma mekongi]|uniref:Uncharacterized protein n=1 Tax=Schistosoma mekongi TaxID=38744 RepID=A0AAE1ZDR7_SCHME|nr:hypothetical protein MN116_005410 [Schistosoma mekongi]